VATFFDQLHGHSQSSGTYKVKIPVAKVLRSEWDPCQFGELFHPIRSHVTIIFWDISSQCLKNNNKHTQENLREIIMCTVWANDGHEAGVICTSHQTCLWL